MRRFTVYLASVVLLAAGVYIWNPFGAPARSHMARLTGFEIVRTPSDSMAPAIEGGASISVSMWPLLFQDPEIGDIVAFKYPPDPAFQYLKRVVAGPGDRIEMAQCSAVVNGTRLTEPYATTADADAPECAMREMVIPSGHYFLLSDVRVGTADSRTYGTVERRSIYAKARLGGGGG